MDSVGTANITKYMKENPEHYRDAVRNNGVHGGEALRKFNTSPRVCDDCGVEENNPSVLRWHKVKEHAYNHKVISVRSLYEREDVYCLQVEDHNNFALAAGVFVHNCGMMAVRTSLVKEDLPEDLKPLRLQIERDIPMGKGRSNNEISKTAHDRCNELETDLEYKEGVAFNKRYGKWHSSLGSLGGGNHFIEVVLDEEDRVWAFLHSGSRGVGNKIARHHMEVARNVMKTHHIYLADKDLSYLSLGTDEFKDYIREMQWAQKFALLNRDEMMDRTLAAMRRHIGAFVAKETIRCHHNFTQWENHFGENILVSRKGAISARVDEMGLIPGSMGTRSYVVRGLGNPASFNTAPHGAGRRMSRTQANKTFTMEDFDRDMEGIEVRRSEKLLDEVPGAYKDVEEVIERSSDLVDVVHTFKQVVNCKGD